MEVSTPSTHFDGWTRTEVCFNGFKSPEFSCFGHKWKLRLFSGGRSGSRDGCAALFMFNMSNAGIKIQFGCSIRDAAGKEVVYHESKPKNVFDGVDSGRGHSNFAKLSVIMDALAKGSLIVEVRMKLIESTLATQFIPKNPITKNILNKFNDEESADVVFDVGNGSQEGRNTRKRAKTTTTFHAHRVILQDGASTLTEMCKQSQAGDSTTSVSITDVKPDIFHHILYYLYGGKIGEEDLTSNAKDIINACDKYGIVNLKLEAEVSYVNSTTLTNGNIIDNLLYADAMNCALLKEAAMDYIVANKKDIMGKVSFDNVPGAMMSDLLAAVARGEESEYDDSQAVLWKPQVSDAEDGEGESIDYNKMRVGTLRKILDEKGLDVDGSRETMIALLKENA